MNVLDARYWTNRYSEGATGWDIGRPSPPLMDFAESVAKDSRILIPGAGNAHDWIELKRIGYEHVFALDFASEPLDRLKALYPQWSDGLIQEDFFDHQGSYDLIFEQTFFCALAPHRRADYVKKMSELLSDEGLLVGVLFTVEFEREGPPFGGSENEYLPLFQTQFDLQKMEPCLTSIPPRQGSELFFVARKKG